MWVWAWNQKPWCTDVQRQMHRGEDAEVKSQHLKPTIQSLMGCQGYKWMDELRFYVPSTVFQSFRDDERVNMKGSVQ